MKAERKERKKLRESITLKIFVKIFWVLLFILAVNYPRLCSKALTTFQKRLLTFLPAGTYL